MVEPKLQVIIDGLVGDLAEQCKVRHSDLLFLRTLEHGLLDLGLSSCTSTIAYIGSSLGTTEASTLLLSANGTSRVTLGAIALASLDKRRGLRMPDNSHEILLTMMIC